MTLDLSGGSAPAHMPKHTCSGLNCYNIFSLTLLHRTAPRITYLSELCSHSNRSYPYCNDLIAVYSVVDSQRLTTTLIHAMSSAQCRLSDSVSDTLLFLFTAHDTLLLYSVPSLTSTTTLSCNIVYIHHYRLITAFSLQSHISTHVCPRLLD
jgi:hypothetical protein